MELCEGVKQSIRESPVPDTLDRPRTHLSGKRITVSVLGALQILSWGSTFYLPAVLAGPIARDTAWPYDQVVAGLSLGLLVAGLVSPRVGRLIALHGGRPVLASAAALIALGLATVGMAQNLLLYFVGWTVIGVGMGAGLYDAAFATLGTIYGKEARGPISSLTLFGGFASTVCWPFSAFLVETVGWRNTCLAYAAIHLAVAAPLCLAALPRGRRMQENETPGVRTAALARGETLLFWMLAIVLTVGAAILSLVGAHLVTFLQARGLELSAAVALGMLLGPSQVGARLVEVFAGNRYHPIWTMIASVSLVALGALLFLAGQEVYAVAIILYGGGNGIGSIAKGTLPLALFGPARYALLVGRLALPVMCAMAIAPYLGAVAIRQGGGGLFLAILIALTIVNVVLVAGLWIMSAAKRGQG
jgi:predicted MFS family arabinose efflux permease